MPKPGMHSGDVFDETLNLAMSEKAKPLYDAVRKFIAEEVEPMAAKFYELAATREEKWGYAPGQLEMLDEGKAKAKAQADKVAATQKEAEAAVQAQAEAKKIQAAAAATETDAKAKAKVGGHLIT